MNYLDLIIGLLLLLGVIRGLFKGFIASVASLAGLIIGIWASIKFAGVVGGWLASFIHTKPEYINVVSFILIFIGVAIALSFLGSLVEKIAESIQLGFANKILGGLFGFFKAALMISFLLVLMNTFFEEGKIIPTNVKEGSRLYKPVSAVFPGLFPGYANLTFSLDDEDVKNVEL